MEIVNCEEKYWEFVRNLRNHESVKPGFIQQEDITVEKHVNFMKKNNGSFYICIYNNNPVGYVGVINDDIRVATLPEMQGKGIGKFMILEISDKFPNAFAKVKLENEPSLRLFESCGFKKKYYLLERES